MKTMSQTGVAGDRTSVNLPLFVGLGVLAWVAGVLLIRFAGASFFVEGSAWLVGLYMLTIPGAWLLVKGIALATKLSGTAIVTAIVIMNATATLLDGAAIAWLPSLYGVLTPALAAAWLLWFVGVSSWASILISRAE